MDSGKMKNLGLLLSPQFLQSDHRFLSYMLHSREGAQQKGPGVTDHLNSLIFMVRPA
jgi:hypothetical protein